MTTLDDFRIPEPEAPKKKSRKRAHGAEAHGDPAVKELKDRAKFYCKNVHEWKVVSRYNRAKLEEYLNDMDYLQSAETYQQCSDVLTNVYAYVLDRLVRGDGLVEHEIKSDVSLRHCIHRELVEVLKVVTNRLQILLFSAVDVVHGKKRQRNDGSRVAGSDDNLNNHLPVSGFQALDPHWEWSELASRNAVFPGAPAPEGGEDPTRETEDIQWAD